MAMLPLKRLAAGRLVALAVVGAGLRPVATLMLAVLVALVAYEVSRNLRSDAHLSPEPSAE
jgi:hypothetical protein